jgi:F0F1-type ATP synthase assembly protein I
MKLGPEFRGMGQYLSLGIQMVVVTVVGAVVGWWLDKKTGRAPVFLIVFFILGALGGMMAVWRAIYEQRGGPKR